MRQHTYDKKIEDVLKKPFKTKRFTKRYSSFVCNCVRKRCFIFNCGLTVCNVQIFIKRHSYQLLEFWSTSSCKQKSLPCNLRLNKWKNTIQKYQSPKNVAAVCSQVRKTKTDFENGPFFFALMEHITNKKKITILNQWQQNDYESHVVDEAMDVIKRFLKTKFLL